MNPGVLVDHKVCVYEEENSTAGKIASLGCEETLGGGFIFAVDKQHCELSLEQVRELLETFEGDQ